MMIVQSPDTTRRAVDRLRKNRILAQGKEKIKYKCGRCKNIGHNHVRYTELIAHDDNVGASGGATN